MSLFRNFALGIKKNSNAYSDCYIHINYPDGSHPFYLDLKANGSAHGVFLRNSNGMDIDITASSITYNIIGGKSTPDLSPFPPYIE